MNTKFIKSGFQQVDSLFSGWERSKMYVLKLDRHTKSQLAIQQIIEKTEAKRIIVFAIKDNLSFDDERVAVYDKETAMSTCKHYALTDFVISEIIKRENKKETIDLVIIDDYQQCEPDELGSVGKPIGNTYMEIKWGHIPLIVISRGFQRKWAWLKVRTTCTLRMKDGQIIAYEPLMHLIARKLEDAFWKLEKWVDEREKSKQK